MFIITKLAGHTKRYYRTTPEDVWAESVEQATHFEDCPERLANDLREYSASKGYHETINIEVAPAEPNPLAEALKEAVEAALEKQLRRLMIKLELETENAVERLVPEDLEERLNKLELDGIDALGRDDIQHEVRHVLQDLLNDAEVTISV